MSLLQENAVVADKFRLIRMIGRGGMGSVWQAQHVGLDTPCAVKFIEGDLANVAEAHARFEREAKAAAQLRSPNVVQVIDHGVWQGHPYIAMELLEGEDLGKRLVQSKGRLSPPEVNFVIQQVCRALSKAHAAGVVHRDLKPDNIFVVKDDDRDIVKILDFGVAKSASQAIDGSNTKTGAMLGTPYYMSPEQAQGIKSVDSRSDLWSLAVIVFQCLTGRLPFESEALGDLLVKIIVSQVPVPSQVYPGVPIGFDEWWRKAADRNPDGRFQTAKQFAESLSLALGQSSITDITDRSRLNRGSDRPGGGTAMMVNAVPTDVMGRVPNTPQPGANTAAMVTPNPAQHNTPQGYGQAHPSAAPHHASQPGTPYGQPPMGPPPGQPGYGYGHSPAVTTGNPVAAATFSGVEPPAGVPKKGAPVALFVGVGLLAMVGLGLGGVALIKGRAAGRAGDEPSVASASATASGSAPMADPTAAATKPAESVAAADRAAGGPDAPVAKDSAADAGAPVVAAAGAGAGGAAHRPIAPGTAVATTPKSATTAAGKPPTTAATTTAAAPPASGKPKPFNLGF